MNVLINALQAGNLSGTGRYVTELVRALAALPDGPEMTLVWPAGQPAPGFGPRTDLVRRGSGTFRRLLDDHWGILELTARKGAEAVHYPANFGPSSAVRGLVVTVHDLSFVRHPEWFRLNRALYYRFMLKRTARVATRFLADSEATAADLRAFLRLPEDRIDVAPLGVSTHFRPAPEAALAAVRGKYRLPERFLLYVGTLEPRKNLARLIAAWSRLSREEAPPLVVAGRVGWKTEAVKRAAAESPRRTEILFPGFVPQEELPALYSAAQAFVWPSLFEGFGLPPLEAMACGTPVVTSNTSSLPEAVGDAALTVDPLDEDALSDAIRRVVTDSGLRAALREQGLARAALFSWQRTAALTLETYQRARS